MLESTTWMDGWIMRNGRRKDPEMANIDRDIDRDIKI